tara:strand:- start:1144 stop:1428 length:285 start_codon:yes stop_codon:yes gene_type:complete
MTQQIYSALNHVLSGGGAKVPENNNQMLIVFMLSLLILMVKSILVQMTYNNVMPVVIASFKEKYDPLTEFRPLNLPESVLLVILFNNLFGKNCL